MINLHKSHISWLNKKTRSKHFVKYLKNRNDISVYEYYLLATLFIVGATVSIVEYLL